MKHFFRFTIRELFLLIAIVGLGLGWWLDRLRVDAKFEVADARAYVLEGILYEVGFDIEWRDGRVKAESSWMKIDCLVDKTYEPVFRQRPMPKH